MTDHALEMHLPRKGPSDVLERRERELARPAAGEVRVVIEAAGVAYADIVMRQGLYSGFKPPVTPGYDFVGRIEAIGEGVEDFKTGQRVAGMTIAGSYASRRNVEARWLVPAPEGADAVKLAAAVLNGLTAWQLFHRAVRVERDEWVLVHGAAGGVGSLLLDLARLAGVKTIGTASAYKMSVVADRGGVPIDYNVDDVVARVRGISREGVSAAFDHVGGKHFKRVSMPCLRQGGTGVLYGGYNATRGGKVNPLALLDLVLNGSFSSLGLFTKGQGVVGYSAPVWRDARPDVYRRDLSKVLQLVADGTLSPLVAKTYALEEAAQAHRDLETRAVSGKIVLVMGA